LLLLLMRRPSFGKAVAVTLGILCFGIAIRAYVYLHHVAIFPRDDDALALAYVEKIYYPTHTRLDGLLVGVTLATIKTFRPTWWQRAMSHGYLLLVSGLALCACAIWLFSDRLSFSASVIGFPLLAIGLGLVIASSIAPSSPLSKVRGFALIAALAYSAYLTHKEVIHFVREHLPRLPRLARPVRLLCLKLSDRICPVHGHRTAILAVEGAYFLQGRQSSTGGRYKLNPDLPLELSSCKIYL
jgi:peptidoglycan/LPS O-acetylase OafA/YrhL